MNKYLVGVLYYGPIDRDHDRCIKALKGHPLIHDVMELTGCPYIDMGRSIIATAVLDDPSLGGVMFIDHDMIFEPDALELCILGAESAAAVCGGAYSMRRTGKIIGAIDGTKLPEGKKIVFFEGGEVLPANYLGMGMTAISRSVLVRLVKASKDRQAQQQANVAKVRSALSSLQLNGSGYDPNVSALAAAFEELVPELEGPALPRLTTGLSDAPCVPFFSHLQRIMACPEPGREGYYFGEDVSFCLRSREADLPVLLDTRVRVYHKGSYCYGLEDVGMEVPYCTRLEVVDPSLTTPGAEATPRPAFHSTDPAVQRALDEEHPEAVLSKPLQRSGSTSSEASSEASP